MFTTWRFSLKHPIDIVCLIYPFSSNVTRTYLCLYIEDVWYKNKVNVICYHIIIKKDCTLYLNTMCPNQQWIEGCKSKQGENIHTSENLIPYSLLSSNVNKILWERQN